MDGARSGPTARILIADDEPANVRVLEQLLARAGYSDVHGTTRSAEVLELVQAIAPDLIVLDLRMPPPDGLQILADLPTVLPAGEYLPVLVLTADAEGEARHRVLAAGAHDFVTKPFDAVEIVLRIRNLLRTRALHLELQRQNQALEERVRERTDRLLQVEKLSAMGQLLAGVAHELNNPLSVVHGQSLLLYRAPAASTAARAEKIMQASNRCVRIVRNFLKLARHWPAERSRVDLDGTIRDAVDLAAFELSDAEVEIRLDLAGDLPAVAGDPHQLHQVFVNLIVNALYAMRPAPAPRVLEIRTRWQSDLARIVATVRDSGPGVPPQDQRRIFDPFFTTKPVGEGTGLGLSLSAGVIQDHGGTIRLESEPGQGAAFVIELPAKAGGCAAGSGVPRPHANGAVTASDAGSPSTSDAGAAQRIVGKRILVVDDEGDVAAVLGDLLRLDGHHVDTAGDGAAALDALARGGYDAILTDTRMPVLDGPGFYRALARRHPALAARVGFITGDTLNTDRREFLEATGLPLIAKPFEPDEVRDAVQRLLRTEHPPAPPAALAPGPVSLESEGACAIAPSSPGSCRLPRYWPSGPDVPRPRTWPSPTAIE